MHCAPLVITSLTPARITCSVSLDCIAIDDIVYRYTLLEHSIMNYQRGSFRTSLIPMIFFILAGACAMLFAGGLYTIVAIAAIILSPVLVFADRS